MPPSNAWQLQAAKNHFSEVVEESRRSGPQIVTKHGKEAAVVLSFEDFQKLAGRKESLAEFFGRSPLRGAKLAVQRDRSPVRGGPSF